jgi:hypothetical protein
MGHRLFCSLKLARGRRRAATPLYPDAPRPLFSFLSTGNRRKIVLFENAAMVHLVSRGYVG